MQNFSEDFLVQTERFQFHNHTRILHQSSTTRVTQALKEEFWKWTTLPVDPSVWLTSIEVFHGTDLLGKARWKRASTAADYQVASLEIARDITARRLDVVSHYFREDGSHSPIEIISNGPARIIYVWKEIDSENTVSGYSEAMVEISEGLDALNKEVWIEPYTDRGWAFAIQQLIFMLGQIVDVFDTL